MLDLGIVTEYEDGVWTAFSLSHPSFTASAASSDDARRKLELLLMPQMKSDGRRRDFTNFRRPIKTQSWMNFKCPSCKADAGTLCTQMFSNGTVFNRRIPHNQRLVLSYPTSKSLQNSIPKRIDHQKGSVPSVHCGWGHHSQCDGFHSRGYPGFHRKCTCTCHAQHKVVAPS